jgi:hypothetical protein
LSLEPGGTKNQEGRLVFLTPELRRDIADHLARVKALERMTMAVLGHKTTSMLHRYFIVSPSDLQDVACRLSDKGTDNRAHLGDGRIISS